MKNNFVHWGMTVKTKRLVVISVAATAVLVGCGSFNHYSYPEGAVFLLPSPVQAGAKPPEPQPSQPGCPMFVMPKLPKPPELPLDELAKVSPDDSEALDRIQQTHIAKLRAYIINTNKTLARAYQSYQLSCEMRGVLVD